MSRHAVTKSLRYSLGVSLVCISLSFSCRGEFSGQAEVKRPNVVFIAVDDLRPQLGAYGLDFMVTPHMDRLASQGRLFSNHFVQAPTCGASRYSMLRSIRPTDPEQLKNSAFYELIDTDRPDQPESIAHYFRENGYRTVGIGKISHTGDGKIFTYEGEGDGRPEMPKSWDEFSGPVGKWGTAWNAFFAYSDGSNRNMKRGAYPAYERAEGGDEVLPDGWTAQAAVDKIAELKDETFFLGIGFFKPHLPFTAPAKYWDYYDRDKIELSPNPNLPKGVGESSLHDSNEMFRNYGPHDSKGASGVVIDGDYAKLLRHAYFAAVSYADAQIGKVVDALEENDLLDNTIIVVWGDHGWHLGDHTIWGKHTTYDRSLKSTLIIRAPEMARQGVTTESLVESVDLFPTLVDLAGLDSVKGVDGVSLRPILENPETSVKSAVFSAWRNRQSIRTSRYRMTRYQNSDVEFELFDHQVDPNETINVAKDRREIVALMSEAIDEGNVHFQDQ